MKKYIIYHDRCPDGLSAAALFKVYSVKYDYEDAHTYHFIPGNYNMTYEELDIQPNSIVYFVDFSFKREMFERILEEAHTVFLLDHHKTAYDELNHLFENNKLKVYFDLNECGSSITYKYLFPNKPLPLVLQHIRDQDLWLWEHPDSLDYCAFLSMKELSFQAYYDYYKAVFSLPTFNESYNNSLYIGKMVRESLERDAVSVIETNMIKRTIDGTEMCIVNCPSKLTGYVKKEVIEKDQENVLITYALGSKGMRVSIRVADGQDAIAIAKKIDPIKAGGHTLAAGAFIPYSLFKEHWFTKEIFSL